MRGENFDDFVAQRKHVLVATDLAARGLDTLDVKHVVQVPPPIQKKTCPMPPSA